MSKFFFDGRFINTSKPDGISRFSLGLISALKNQTSLTVLVCDEEQKSAIGAGVEFIDLPKPTSALEIFTALRLNRYKPDVVFSPMQTTSGLGRKFRLILTLHDLIYYRHRTPPKEFSPLIRLAWWLYHLSYWPQRIVLNSADAVVTVSETSKAQMQRHRLTNRSITVIYNAADGPVKQTPVERKRSNRLLYMGSFIGYKNVETLIRAVGLRPNHVLVLLSRISSERRGQLEALAQEVGARLEFRNGVTEVEYVDELLSAKALLSASKDEGFGIPVVEAMSQGTPVILSDLEIFHEVAASAGLYFPADSAQDLALHLDLLDQPDRWKLHSELGKERSRTFSWQVSAKQLLKLADSLA